MLCSSCEKQATQMFHFREERQSNARTDLRPSLIERPSTVRDMLLHRDLGSAHGQGAGEDSVESRSLIRCAR
jgi:hypothetical protein